MSNDLTVPNLVKALTDPSSSASNVALSRSLSLRRQWEDALRRETSQYTKPLEGQKGDAGEALTEKGVQKWAACPRQRQLGTIGSDGKVSDSRATIGATGTAFDPSATPPLVRARAKDTRGTPVQPVFAGGYMQLQDSPLAPPMEQRTFGAQDFSTRLVSRAFWAPYAVHVTQNGADVNVWIRARILKKGDGQRLLLQLRTHLARTGVRLAKMVINGKVEWQSGNTA